MYYLDRMDTAASLCSEHPAKQARNGAEVTTADMQTRRRVLSMADEVNNCTQSIL
jgi:hypothetical protein